MHMDIYEGDYVYIITYDNRYRYERKMVSKVMDAVIYTDYEYITFLERKDYCKTWFRTEKEAIWYSGHLNYEIKKATSQ